MKITGKCAGITLLIGCSFCCGAVEGEVDASWLNARVFPELKAPVAVKLPRGKKIDVVRRWHNWLEIAAPDITRVYVSAARLDGDKAVSDVNLRVRPASSGAVIGRLKANDKVKVLSVPDKFGWVQIAPSADLRLYVCRDYVKCDLTKVPEEDLKKKEVPAEKPAAVPAKAEVKPAAKPAVVPAKTEVKPAAKPVAVPAKTEVKPAAKPAVVPAKTEVKPAAKPVAAPVKADVKPAVVPAKAEVKPAAAQKNQIPVLNAARKLELEELNADILNPAPFRRSGSLNAVPASVSPCTNFALLDDVSGRNQAFLFSDLPSVNLKKLEGKNVNVSGYSYKINGWKSPVVYVTEIKTI